ncbi:kynureninase [Bacteriovoracaceae bacterium]|nr:kynureninase [Bacteriovoracaceae bacterium]
MMAFENSEEFATRCDQEDQLSGSMDKFHLPQELPYYFSGHSLGPRPVKALNYIQDEFSAWEKYGVEGHFESNRPWVKYHEFLNPMMARVVGAKEKEVVVMNTLTVNLHLALVSFYRPTKTRYKILIEANSFPSDHYAVQSQAKFHGFNPAEAIIELPTENGFITDPSVIIETIKKHKDELALVMLGNCNYLSGQYFDIQKISEQAKSVGAKVGFNLAHGAGNLPLKLNQQGPDFAVWCSYKYLNSGPGNLSGFFVHERHHKDKDLPRFAGWWGHNKERRFRMETGFDPIEGAEGWQLSNPPIFSLAAFLASLEIFDEYGMDNIWQKSQNLTGYFRFLLEKNCSDILSIVTPENSKGSMLCLQFKSEPKDLLEEFKRLGVSADFRYPNIIRMTPAALYTSFKKVYEVVQIIKQHGGEAQ